MTPSLGGVPAARQPSGGLTSRFQAVKASRRIAMKRAHSIIRFGFGILGASH
jgi:hypothetical protein